MRKLPVSSLFNVRGRKCLVDVRINEHIVVAFSWCHKILKLVVPTESADHEVATDIRYRNESCITIGTVGRISLTAWYARCWRWAAQCKDSNLVKVSDDADINANKGFIQHFNCSQVGGTFQALLWRYESQGQLVSNELLPLFGVRWWFHWYWIHLARRSWLGRFQRTWLRSIE